MAYDWPSTGIAPKSVSFALRGLTVRGPVSVSGRSQVAAVDAGYWVATLSVVPAGGPGGVKLYRSLLAILKASAAQVRVPVFDADQAPWPLDGSGNEIRSADAVTHDDGTTFDDGTGYAMPVIDVELSADAALRATLIAVTVIQAGTIVGGEHFSLGDRLHLIRQVISDDGAGNLSLAIVPPLREAWPAGTVLNFDRPVDLMQLDTEQSGDLDLTFGRYGFPDLTFVESFA